MPVGDAGLVAKLLSELLEFSTGPTGYQQMKREDKLDWLMRGINESLQRNDYLAYDVFTAEYRELRRQTGF